MKKIILFSTIIFAFCTISAQNQALSPLPKGEKTLGQKRLELRQESLSINNAGGKRALNYGALMDELYGGIKFSDVPIFPDTLKREFFGGRLGNIYTFYLANLFDAAAQTFKNADEFNGTSGIYVTDKNAYSLDSIEIYVRYLRNKERYMKYETSSLSMDTISQDTVGTSSGTADTFNIEFIVRDSIVIDTINTKIVDTLLVEIFNDNDKSNLIDTFVEGIAFDVDISEVYPDHDTVFFKNIRYDRFTNTMVATEKVQYKVILDSTYYEQNGLQILPMGFSGTPTGPMKIDADGLVAVGYTFIPGFDDYSVQITKVAVDDTTNIGYDTVILQNQAGDADSIFTYTVTYFTQRGFNTERTSFPDSVSQNNSLEVEAYEEQGRDNYPIYFASEFSNGYSVGENIFYEIPDSVQSSFFGRLEPRYSQNEQEPIENLDISHIVSCQTCLISGIEEGMSFEIKDAYPNPIQKGELVTLPIQFKNVGDLSISVYSSLGKLVSEKTGSITVNGNFELQIETNKLPVGMNIVSVESNGQKAIVRLVVMP
ncbi:MAG: hypothetical protein ACJAZ3_001212 [Sphingobacteriales bacterium]|jgi:hypothetical protein